MAVARAAVLEPLHELPFPVTQRALVVGGGLAGLAAALTIADAGYRVYLPDIQERLGGSLAQKMRYTLEGHEIQPYHAGAGAPGGEPPQHPLVAQRPDDQFFRPRGQIPQQAGVPRQTSGRSTTAPR